MLKYHCVHIYFILNVKIGGESMNDIMDAAHYMVYLSYHQSIGSLTPLKLQKILYIAQGWSYVWDDHPLFQNEFEAWQYGPVNVKVYNHFKEYGRNEIPEREGRMYHLTELAMETLEAVWERYCSYSAFELVELTHSQEPWIKAYRSGATIKNSDIKRFFQSTY